MFRSFQVYQKNHFFYFTFSDEQQNEIDIISSQTQAKSRTGIVVEGCTASHEKWKMDFGTLLADRQGVDAFRAFLEKNHQDQTGSKLMTMWLIYEGTLNNLNIFVLKSKIQAFGTVHRNSVAKTSTSCTF